VTEIVQVQPSEAGEVLNAGGGLAALATFDTATTDPTTMAEDDEFEALELARRVAASDVSTTTLTGLEEAFDRLAIAYQRTPPTVLLREVRRYLRYVGQVIDKRATLAQRRRLVVVGGWLSLLAATIDIDLHLPQAGTARLATAASLADEAGHSEPAAWCQETRRGTPWRRRAASSWQSTYHRSPNSLLLGTVRPSFRRQPWRGGHGHGWGSSVRLRMP
jgi:hypothetical protein